MFVLIKAKLRNEEYPWKHQADSKPSSVALHSKEKTKTLF